MTARHLALAAMALAVLGMGVYLFVEVRATPAQAQAASPAPRPHAPEVASDRPAPPVAEPHGKPGLPGTAPVAPRAAEGETHAVRLGTTIADVSSDDPTKANPHLDAIMDQANKAYDRQDFDEAKAIAGKILAKDPTNVRMLRVIVSSSCIDGDSTTAQKYFEQLPKFDREQMKQRCDRYGVTFKEPAQ